MGFRVSFAIPIAILDGSIASLRARISTCHIISITDSKAVRLSPRLKVKGKDLNAALCGFAEASCPSGANSLVPHVDMRMLHRIRLNIQNSVCPISVVAETIILFRSKEWMVSGGLEKQALV